MAYNVVSLLTLCILGLAVHLTKCVDVYNNLLTEEQVNILFHRKDEDVPKYHAVHVETVSRHRSRRNAERYFRFVQFQIREKNHILKLILRERSVFVFTNPVWRITSVSNQNYNYTYKVVDPGVHFDGIFFENRDRMGILLAHYDKKRRQILYDGLFDFGREMHVLRSVPEKWIITFNENKTLMNEHVVYKIENSDKKSRSLFLNVEDSDFKDKLDIPVSVLYIKILPVVDYELFRLLGENIEEALRYIATFWNAIDLQFRTMNTLTIEITVTGTVIATDEHALTFIDNSRNKLDSRKVNAYELLEQARMHFYENFIKDTNFTNYDAIFVMTALDTEPTAGMSYIGRLCNRLYSTAFIQDDANFLGLHPAAHELGHLLNFYHDGSDDAKDCEPYPNINVTTVMAPLVTTAKSILWSQCSKNSLVEFVKTKAAKCLKEKHRIK